MFALLFLRRATAAALLLSLATLAASRADGPKDNQPDDVRPIPPKGVDIPAEQMTKFRNGIDKLAQQIALTKTAIDADAKLKELLPDVEIFLRAVQQAVEYKEFFNAKEFAAAEKLLDIGSQRAKELAEGKPSWPTATGLVIRGYRSEIDDTVQPYGLVVPADFAKDSKTPRRLDFWWHGRGETLSEVNFITGRMSSPGEFTPEGAFVLHPYGRYSNANKFAGEADTFECLRHVSKHYPIDFRLLVARGFSMGGAACWQFAVHHPTLWCAANPGAGFAETPEFLNVFQNEKVAPTWYEEKLWHMYNATDYAQNIFNLPTVAYSGEDDRQKQAADVMAREMKKVGLELTHIIGPKTGHKYEPGAKKEVAKRIDEIAAKGKEEWPTQIKFVTYTLKYHHCAWLSVNGLGKHWEEARVDAKIEPGKLIVDTKNVTDFDVRLKPEWFTPQKLVTVIDGKAVAKEEGFGGDRRRFAKIDGVWTAIDVKDDNSGQLLKRPGLQGPIDHAFMERFIMVRPTGKSTNEQVEKWVEGEMRHAIEHWRKHFRGDAILKADSEITDADIASSNLVLWGDPSSNAVLRRIADKLPVKWIVPAGVTIGDKSYDSRTHVPVMIYPNPLNPKKYVVLNSGFTFREYAYLNNARQVPMLPDYAVVDVTTPPNSRYPGKIVRAGFFGEKWELLPKDGQ